MTWLQELILIGSEFSGQCFTLYYTWWRCFQRTCCIFQTTLSFWVCCRLAASGPLFVSRGWYQLIWKALISFYCVMTPCYWLWMERLIVTTDYMKPEPDRRRTSETCFAFSRWMLESFLLCTLLPSNQFYKLHSLSTWDLQLLREVETSERQK